MIAAQECGSTFESSVGFSTRVKEWEKVLVAYFSAYTLVKCESVGGVHLSVFVRDHVMVPDVLVSEAGTPSIATPSIGTPSRAELISVNRDSIASTTAKPLITNLGSGKVTTGVGNVLKNKGAAAISLSYRGVSFLFISCHLAAHQDSVADRNRDYDRIKSELSVLGKYRANDMVDRFDHVFWMGDLNVVLF